MATVITDAGRAIITNRLMNAGTSPKYAAWGTGAGTAVVANTTLFTEASEARVSGTESRVQTTVPNDTYQVVATLTADGTKSITNAGLFDAATVGNLFLKGDFTAVPLLAADSMTFTMKAVFA